MDAEITPEPSPLERAAVVFALEQLAERERALDRARSAWWQAGIEENVSAEEDQAAAGPRSSRGARRA